MYYYIRLRKKGSCNRRAFKLDGRIAVFKRIESARAEIDSVPDTVPEIVSFDVHPSHRQSPIYRRKYAKVDW